jgi:hypothetical protein
MATHKSFTLILEFIFVLTGMDVNLIKGIHSTPIKITKLQCETDSARKVFGFLLAEHSRLGKPSMR